MNVKLKSAFERLGALPEAEQAEVAALIEAWLNGTRAPGAWPQPELEAMADAAIAEHRAGKTKPLDFRRG